MVDEYLPFAACNSDVDFGFCYFRFRSADTVEVQIPPFKGNTLFEDSAGTLSNGAGSYFFVGRTAPLDYTLRRGLIAFYIADSIPAGSEIVSAQLQLYMSKTISGAESLNLHRLLANWGESTSNAPGNEGGGDSSDFLDATWTHTYFDIGLWNTSGGDYEVTTSAGAPVSGIGTYLIGLTAGTASDVQLWLDNPDTNFGWILIGNESVTSTAKRFDTKENGVAGNRPLLTVQYVPPPCCIGIRGDCNNDGTDANILDLNFLVNRVFRAGPALGPC